MARKQGRHHHLESLLSIQEPSIVEQNLASIFFNGG